MTTIILAIQTLLKNVLYSLLATGSRSSWIPCCQWVI